MPPLRPPPSDAELLARLVREARQEAPPALDEARLERELFRRLDAEPQPEAARPAYWPLRFVVAGVAAAAAFAVANKREPAPAPVAVAPPVAPAGGPKAHEAGDDALAFDRPGLASWTLEPHARASLIEDGDRVVLALERGALRVDVVPATLPGAERFAVLVDGARVSVRGTHFRVARAGERFDVDVTQGVVAVTPPAGGPGSAWLLPAPRGGTFRVDGAEGSLREVVPFDLPVVAFQGATPAAPGRHAPPAPALPKLPEVEVARAGWARQVSQCFAQEARPNPQVNVMVATRLRVEFRPEGRMRSLAFEPPLAPSVEACARQKLGAELGPAGAHELSLSLSGR